MKKNFWRLVSLFPLAVALGSCSQAETIELTKDNFYDYFTRFEGSVGVYDEGERISDFRFVEEDPKDPGISAFFYVKKEVYEDKYFNNCQITMAINCYGSKAALDAGTNPSIRVTFTSKLHYYTADGATNYYLGCYFIYNKISYYATSGKDLSLTSYEIPELASNYEKHDYEYTDFYREIVIEDVSGKIESGGLAGLNSIHCN